MRAVPRLRPSLAIATGLVVFCCLLSTTSAGAGETTPPYLDPAYSSYVLQIVQDTSTWRDAEKGATNDVQTILGQARLQAVRASLPDPSALKNLEINGYTGSGWNWILDDHGQNPVAYYVISMGTGLGTVSPFVTGHDQPGFATWSYVPDGRLWLNGSGTPLGNFHYELQVNGGQPIWAARFTGTQDGSSWSVGDTSGSLLLDYCDVWCSSYRMSPSSFVAETAPRLLALERGNLEHWQGSHFCEYTYWGVIPWIGSIPAWPAWGCLYKDGDPLPVLIPEPSWSARWLDASGIPNNPVDMSTPIAPEDFISTHYSARYSPNGGPDPIWDLAAARAVIGANPVVADWVNCELTQGPGAAICETRDNTPPTITAKVSPEPNAAGWNNGPVTVTFTCSDEGSGIATCPDPVTVSSEGADQVVSGTATDKAGNSASTQVEVSIDATTAPTITAKVSPEPNAAGWNDGPVTVTFTCSDEGSGIASCPGPVTVSSEGADQVVSGTATDKSGNSASTQVEVSIDATTAPTITAKVSPKPNAAGWNNGPVTVTFTCSDRGSGIASCPAAVTLGQDANQTVTGTARDKASNTASISVSNINIDTTPPVVGYRGNAGSYTVDQTVEITCSASDLLSGIATNSCVNASGPAYSFGVGRTSLSASTTDKAGNTATASTSFTIVVNEAGVDTLIRRFVTNSCRRSRPRPWTCRAGVARALISKVASIVSARNQNAKTREIRAFDNQVDAQTGRSLTASQAALLKQLVGSL